MYHAEVVEASRGNHAVVGTYGLCRSGVVEREIVVDYFILVDVEFVRYGSAHESFGILFGEGDNGNHVALFRQRVAFVDTAVEMDCKMRNGEKRLAETYQRCAGRSGLAQRVITRPAIDSGRSNHV